MLDEERGHLRGRGIRPRSRPRQQGAGDEQHHGDQPGPRRERLGRKRDPPIPGHPGDHRSRVGAMLIESVLMSATLEDHSHDNIDQVVDITSPCRRCQP